MFRSVFVTVLLLSSCVMAHAGGRVALVVGVSNYEHAAHLPNTLNDANDMAAALKRLGFDVETLLDPSRSALEAAVRQYGDRSVGADVRLFHFSGHAVESAEHNWLLPVAVRLVRQRDLRFEAIDLNTIQEQVDGAAKVSIVFLDAPRDNPFARRLLATRRDLSPRGLARVDVAAGGVLEAYSTGPGPMPPDDVSPRRNSPFTASMLQHIETPGLEIKSLLTRVAKDVLEETKGLQRTWQNSSLVDDFYFVPSPAAASAPSPQSVASLESTFWDSIKASRNPGDFQAYLTKFPKGIFVELAQHRMVMLQLEIASIPQVAISAQDTPAPLLERARALISAGDILSARLILRRAHERGEPGAALEIGGTYDPVVLKRLNVSVISLYADPAQARDWYSKAVESGSTDAAQRIKELTLLNQ